MCFKAITPLYATLSKQPDTGLSHSRLLINPSLEAKRHHDAMIRDQWALSYPKRTLTGKSRSLTVCQVPTVLHSLYTPLPVCPLTATTLSDVGAVLTWLAVGGGGGGGGGEGCPFRALAWRSRSLAVPGYECICSCIRCRSSVVGLGRPGEELLRLRTGMSVYQRSSGCDDCRPEELTMW